MGLNRFGILARSAFAAVSAAALPLFAQTNAGSQEEALVLAPPHPELPPSFWEQYNGCIAFGIALVLALGVVAWLLLRSRTAAQTPIEVRTREELEQLRRQNEDGRTLSRVSRSLRRYLMNAFELPPEELTTAEFCQVISASEKIGPDLASKTGEFLRRCDEVKFAPSAPPLQGNAAAQALELVELGETRRAQLKAAQAASSP